MQRSNLQYKNIQIISLEIINLTQMLLLNKSYVW